VRYLSPDATEDLIKEKFSLLGTYNIHVQRVKRQKNYAFVHFYKREDAEQVLKVMSSKSSNQLRIDHLFIIKLFRILEMDLRKTGLTESGQYLEVTWAKPPNTISSNGKKPFIPNNRNARMHINQTFPSNYGSELNPLAVPFDPNSNPKYFKPSTSSGE